jgi:hypothetical protein
LAFANSDPDDERTVLKIEGCDYQVPEEQIITWLSHYGEIKSDLEEDHFRDDNKTGGNNRTGNYSIMMVLEHKIPQLLPMNGRRVKMYHKGIDKLCTKCFGVHRKSDCKSEMKTAWIDYVRHFMTTNDFIPTELYGRWNDLVKNTTNYSSGRDSEEPNTERRDQQEEQNSASQERPDEPVNTKSINKPGTSSQRENQQMEKTLPDKQSPPREVDFGIPTSETEYESMVERMATCGFSRTDLEKILETKKTAFNKATREFRNQEKKKQVEDNKTARKARKDSLSRQTQ